MEYTKENGMALLEKYLGDNEVKFVHSVGVGNCAHMYAEAVSSKFPKIKIDSQRMRFMGYVHDIGQSVDPVKHELRTIELLIKEGIPLEDAWRTMHGQLPEQYSQDPQSHIFLPIGLEGRILTLADTSVDQEEGIISVEERAEKIKSRISGISKIPLQVRKEICEGMDAALPRFQSYRNEVYGLTNMNLKDFQERFAKDY